MLKFFIPCFCCCILAALAVRAGDYTEEEGRAAWEHWKHQRVTESNFHAICDLVQDIGQKNINLSYEILSEYVPMVKKTGNREWTHILLMGWARAKESLTYFSDAEAIYRQAIDNAGDSGRRYDEVMVGMALMYAEWGKTDSLDKHVSLGKHAAVRAGDRE